MTLSELSGYISAEFVKAFGREPQWIAAAPGRVNVIGEHVDYSDGFVLPMAIDRYTVIAAAPAKDSSKITFKSVDRSDAAAPLDLNRSLQPLAKGNWINYPMGVVAGFQKHAKVPGFDALIHTTVPMGGGLSSSAALEVATATLLEAMTGKVFNPVDKALLCQQAEHEFAGMPCGIMDQFISVMGRADHLLLLDCRSRETELVPMRDPAVSLLVTNSNVKHELATGEYGVRRAQCEAAAKAMGIKSWRDATWDMLEKAKANLEDTTYRRARHVIGEIERTPLAAKAIAAGDWFEAGNYMYASHASLRDDYEVSCPEVDDLVEIARGIGDAGGVYGSRITGGGFGGCTVTLVQSSKVDSIMQRMVSEYKKKTGINAVSFVSRPATGATILKK